MWSFCCHHIRRQFLLDFSCSLSEICISMYLHVCDYLGCIQISWLLLTCYSIALRNLSECNDFFCLFWQQAKGKSERMTVPMRSGLYLYKWKLTGQECMYFSFQHDICPLQISSRVHAFFLVYVHCTDSYKLLLLCFHVTDLGGSH